MTTIGTSAPDATSTGDVAPARGHAGLVAVPERIAEFRLLDLLGQGAMGQVYLARDTLLERDVAIKLMNRLTPARLQRFYNEARAVARLQHPNIVAIHRYGEFQSQPYIVEEYIRGDNLAARGKPMPWRRVLDIGVALADGLALAHRRGVLHRDIKPANVVLSENGQPKLIDFGLAKFMDSKSASEDIGGDSGAAGAGLAGVDLDLNPEPAPYLSPQGEGDMAPVHIPGRVARLTRDGQLLGTAHYLAPEIWLGQPATTRSDVYSFGVLLYELVSGQVPYHHVPESRLARAVTSADAPLLIRSAPQVSPRFSAIVDRCLYREPEHRFQSAIELSEALTELPASERAHGLPDGSPYRGLLPFEAEHRSLFFGRDRDIRGVVERLRIQPVVLVAGESGVGKSSLVRAGVAPVIADQGLGDGRVWEVSAIAPGRQPLAHLAEIIASRLAREAAQVERALAERPIELIRALDAYHDDRAGLVVCIDQGEELITTSAPTAASAISEFLALVTETARSLRVLCTVRGDKLIGLARLPGADAYIESSLYILAPLAADEIRDIVVEPARAMGFAFESQALVDQLVETTVAARSGLPLLQFALAQLWEMRDRERGIIAGSALAEIGGVEGALARHADSALRKLVTAEAHRAARDCLLRLVTVHRTRSQLSEDELVHDHSARRALAILCAERLVVAREVQGTAVYAIAHEALVDSWPTLQGWLEEEGGMRAVHQRLRTATEEWQRLGHAREALWRGRQLDEARRLSTRQLEPAQAAFLTASRRQLVRTRRLWALAMFAVVVLAVALYAGLRYQQRAEASRLMSEAVNALGDARGRRLADSQLGQYRAARDAARAVAITDSEDAWREVIEKAPWVAAAYVDAKSQLESARRIDPDSPEVQSELQAVLHEQTLLAHASGRMDVYLSNIQQLKHFDSQPAYHAAWVKPRKVQLRSEPSGLPVRVCHYDGETEPATSSRMRCQPVSAPDPAGWFTPAEITLSPGSYLFTIAATAGGTAAVRYPLWIEPLAVVERGADPADRAPDITVHVDVPDAARIPAGMIYVPAGWFFFGYGQNQEVEAVRTWHETLPLHRRYTNSYLIGRDEVTYEKWLDFLGDLDELSARALLPTANDEDGEPQVWLRAWVVDPVGTLGDFTFEFKLDQQHHLVALGQELVYGARERNDRHDWLHFPVTGVSAVDASLYAEWLDSTGEVPGARLCYEDEWERAARGADMRLFPHGDELNPGDANFDATYGRDTSTFGLDEVGMHPDSDSPFGLRDTVGNARETVLAILPPGDIDRRGGGFFYGTSTNRIPNRDPATWTQRSAKVGFRICADAP